MFLNGLLEFGRRLATGKTRNTVRHAYVGSGMTGTGRARRRARGSFTLVMENIDE
jgi:hypothetical protein